MGNTFGTLFRITTWGESHGKGIGVIIDGCPPRIPITEEEVQFELNRRRPGQSEWVSQRDESDEVMFLSGVFEGQTLGTPISMMVWNKDTRPKDYESLRNIYRPSHADFTYEKKYGIRALSGGGRASARETIGRVAAGALAKKILKLFYQIEILAWTKKIYHIESHVDLHEISFEQIESSPVRCPDAKATLQMMQLIEKMKEEGDSVGGIVSCLAKNVPVGLGHPVFDKLEADLAKAVMSLPACKGFEVGSGFQSAERKGSEHNDSFERNPAGKIITSTNHSGGIQGGISNGMPILIQAVFKPPATILSSQKTLSVELEPTVFKAKGRHDPCVLPRAVPIIEAMVALVLLDHSLHQKALQHNI